MPSCFRDSVAGRRPASQATGPITSTSIYETHLGPASLTWTRTLLGISLHASLHLTPPSNDSNDDSPLHFQIRPWLFWNLKGTRRFHFKIALQRYTINLAWDLTRARFPSTGSPEPSSGFFIAIAIDGEIALIAGDMNDEAHRKMKARKRSRAMMVSRREHVILKRGEGRRMRSYRTAVRIAGTEREIGIELDGGMSVSLDGKKILHVRRLRWKFRGSERVEIDGDDGGRILISWDLHTWLFPCKENSSHDSAAMFVFCFENEEEEKGVSGEKAMEIASGGGRLYGGLVSGYLGRNLNWSWSESSSGGGGGDRRKGSKKILLKTSSSSSSTSASSAASSSVIEWGSTEEAEMRMVDGFTLVVYAWLN